MDNDNEDICITVGELIDALEQYDHEMILGEEYLVVLYNSGVVAEKLGMKPCVVIKEF